MISKFEQKVKENTSKNEEYRYFYKAWKKEAKLFEKIKNGLCWRANGRESWITSEINRRVLKSEQQDKDWERLCIKGNCNIM